MIEKFRTLDEIIYNIIVETLKNEEIELKEINGHDKDNYIGVLSAPELYLAFLIGKNLIKKLSLILEENIIWNREVTKKNGRTDIEMKIGNKSYAFELKIKQTFYNYLNDIDKLNKNYDDNTNKYFIAIIDVHQKELNSKGRKENIEELRKNNINPIKENFEIIKSDKYKNEPNTLKKDKVCGALIGMWKVV